MNAIIAEHLPQIAKLCQEFGVIKLEVFGSASRADFDPSSSDFDFIATFTGKGPGSNYGFRFLDFADALERLLGRRVDLLTDTPPRNPFLAESINESRQTIYEQERSEAFA